MPRVESQGLEETLGLSLHAPLISLPARRQEEGAARHLGTDGLELSVDIL